MDNGEWVYGDLITGVGAKQGRMYILPVVTNLAYLPGCDPLDGYEVDSSTIGQFTGLLDKNGKEVFEGDIISLDSFDPKEYQVSFIEGAFCFAFLSGEYKGQYSSDIHYIQHGGVNQSTVIGTIHDKNETI